jgi:hypothetical protein
MFVPYMTGVLGTSNGLRASLLIVPIALLISGCLLLWLRSKQLLTMDTR